MSLDAAEIDLSKAFVYGQGYVALSRVRSLAGLKVLGMHPNALQVDPKIVQQDKRFHQQSEAAEEAFEAMDGDAISEAVDGEPVPAERETPTDGPGQP
jgi:hypothetical protein